MVRRFGGPGFARCLLPFRSDFVWFRSRRATLLGTRLPWFVLAEQELVGVGYCWYPLRLPLCLPACFPFPLFRSAIFRPAGWRRRLRRQEPVVICSYRSDRCSFDFAGAAADGMSPLVVGRDRSWGELVSAGRRLWLLALLLSWRVAELEKFELCVLLSILAFGSYNLVLQVPVSSDQIQVSVFPF